jgi:hypothetical protein
MIAIRKGRFPQKIKELAADVTASAGKLIKMLERSSARPVKAIARNKLWFAVPV